MGMAYTAVVCSRCNADIPAEHARENENWCSPQCEPVQMRELRRQRDELRAALEDVLSVFGDGDMHPKAVTLRKDSFCIIHARKALEASNGQ
jgi:hypothetical protein